MPIEPTPATGLPQPGVSAERREIDETSSRRANRRDWDRYADEYQRTHGSFLGDVGFVWGPEGLDEQEVRALGPIEGRDVLEVGSGAGQCARWMRSRGAYAIGLDLSARQLQHARRIDEETQIPVPSVHGTGTHLPFASDSFDIVFSSFGALQFIRDIDRCVAEVARVLRPGGRFAFSITHPMRWVFPDDPGPEGLHAQHPYWDRRPYVETDDLTGEVSYVEHHRTLGDWVGLLAAAGFALVRLDEPEWPESHERIWGGWSRARGQVMPGTALLVAELR